MTNIEFAQAWTRKLEALGIVLGNENGNTSSARHAPLDRTTTVSTNSRFIRIQDAEGRGFTHLATKG
jgi:hypothetical protein